jgi:hypothetical protein
LPRVIVWGQYDKSGLRGRKDTVAHCTGHIPDRLKVPYSLITYPDWRDLRGSLSSIKFNPEDTLSDLMFAIRGSVEAGDSFQSVSKVIVLFGQSGLDTLATIVLGAIDAVQFEPFIAMELRKGSEVTNEKRRDISGRKSFEVQRSGLPARHADTTKPQHSVAASVLRVYPNPTGIAAQVEGAAIPAGTYSVEIVAVNGEVSERRDVVVKESGDLLETLDVQQLPTGYYIVRLHQGSKPLGVFPIVVTH